jgi:hypothetical protein
MEFRRALTLHAARDCGGDTRAPPNSSALRMVFLASAIPFVGFGFLDNFIMVSLGGCSRKKCLTYRTCFLPHAMFDHLFC